MKNYGGYKPQVLREAVNISKEQLRYWRKHLDPKPNRPAFSYQDIFVYRIIKSLHEDRFVSIHDLSKFDLSILFDTINKTYFEELEEMVLVLNFETKDILFSLTDEIQFTPNNKLTYLFLNELVDKQLFSFYYFGNEFDEKTSSKIYSERYAS
jgi:hypothetical protein